LTDAETIEELATQIMAACSQHGWSDFAIECGGGTIILITRAGHVHASWNAAGGQLMFTQAGYGAPSFVTANIAAAARHTVSVLDRTKAT
jgi:hypothetical protein